MLCGNSNTAKFLTGRLATEDGHEATTEHHPHSNGYELTGALHTGSRNISRFLFSGKFTVSDRACFIQLEVRSPPKDVGNSLDIRHDTTRFVSCRFLRRHLPTSRNQLVLVADISSRFNSSFAASNKQSSRAVHRPLKQQSSCCCPAPPCPDRLTTFRALRPSTSTPNSSVRPST